MTEGRQALEKNLQSELPLHLVQTRSVCHFPARQHWEPQLREARTAASRCHLQAQLGGYQFKGEILEIRGLQNT